MFLGALAYIWLFSTLIVQMSSREAKDGAHSTNIHIDKGSQLDVLHIMLDDHRKIIALPTLLALQLATPMNQ